MQDGVQSDTSQRRSLFARNSMSLGLVASIVGVLLVGATGWTFFALRSASDEWTRTHEENALQISEIIKAATHFGMLGNRKEDVHHTIRMLARAPGVQDIRIYDKSGMIIFSADEQEIGESVDMAAEACSDCHEQGAPLSTVQTPNRSRTFRNADGDRIVATITAIENSRECSDAACHAHPENLTVLGVLDVQQSMANSDQALYRMQRIVITVTLAMALLLAVVSVLFIDRLVRVPVDKLISGTRRIRQGDLDFRIDTDTATELGQLAVAFNSMTDELRRAREENREWSQTLEHKVVEKTEELRRTQDHLVQMEKMVSLGKMAATVAHELNNPLSGILTYAKLVTRHLDDPAVALVRVAEEGVDPVPDGDLDELLRYLSVIEKESSRCGDIVRNLLLFSRYSGAALAPHHLADIVDRAVMLVEHHLQVSEISLEVRHSQGDDEIVCDPNQVQQALLALLLNAIEAVPEGGEIHVATDLAGAEVSVSIHDTGPGIPAEVLPNVFEPFFSTKDDVEGVGLGLSVAYGIAKRHGGTIDVESEPGQGSTFHLRLLRTPPAEPTADGEW